MFRGLVLVLVLFLTAHAGAIQTLSVLHIKVVFVDGEGRAQPVPRYRLQISDNPATAVPRRVMTSADGTVDVRLAPGNYTVESESPFTIAGKSYEWMVVVDVISGRNAAIELTNKNAEVAAEPDMDASPLEADRMSLLTQWQDGLFTLWTETAHGSGFLIDANGVVATDAHVIGAATSVEVQLTPAVKVTGAVVATDLVRGVALVRINPAIAAAAKAVPLGCEIATAPGVKAGNEAPRPLATGDEVFALEAPLGRRYSTAGDVQSVLANFIDVDLGTGAGSSGGPAFDTSGRMIGLVVSPPPRDGDPPRTRILRTSRMCEFVASAAAKVTSSTAPSAAHLPVEGPRRVTTDATSAASTGQVASPNLYQASTSDFDVRFITPAQLTDFQSLPSFGSWSEYVRARPPVLLIRVTPKLAEGFWTKVGRAAAMTQGVSIPSIKRPKEGFGSMRALCGEAQIGPVHPFKLEHRLTPGDTMVEGLYAFSPDAIAPSCSSVTLQLFSAKEPRKADTLTVDAKLIQLIWKDLAPYR